MSTGINPVRRSVCIYQGLQCICSTLVSVSSLLVHSLIWGQENHQTRGWFGLEGLFKSLLVQLALDQVSQSSIQPADLGPTVLVSTQLACWSATKHPVTAWTLLRPLPLPLSSNCSFLWVLAPLEDFVKLFWKLKCQNFQPLLLWLDVWIATAVAAWVNSASHHYSEMKRNYQKAELTSIKCQMIPSPCFWASVWAERIPSQPGFLHDKPLPHGQLCAAPNMIAPQFPTEGFFETLNSWGANPNFT